MKTLTYLLPFLFISQTNTETNIIQHRQILQLPLEKSTYVSKDEPWRKSYSIRFVNNTESAITIYGPTAISPSGTPIDAIVTIEPHGEGILNTSIWIQNAEIQNGFWLSFVTDLPSFQVYGFSIFGQFDDRNLYIDRQFILNNSGTTPPTITIERWVA